jgi:tetratricopeptide (TPR) repeat protein
MRSPFPFLLLALLLACESSVASPPTRLDWAQSERGGVAPPRLTGTDGAGLALVSLEAQVVLQAPLAFTELHMRFRNPEGRTREGNFEITLPASAAISRFAMKIGDHFQEGEVVERKEAQQVYEAFLHRRQDPALLEHDAGNRFRARVFPIAAHADKEIILSYSEELSAKGDDYRLHLAGLPVVPSLKVRVLVGGGEHNVEQMNAEPRGDLVLIGGRAVLSDIALRSGGLYLLRTKPKLDDTPGELSALTILYDTSASGVYGFDARAERVLRLVQELAQQAKQDFAVRLFGFDQSTKPLFAGPASRLVDEGLPALRKRGPLGASNLQQAFSALTKEKLGNRLLLVSDAVVTAGEQGSSPLADAVFKLGAQGLSRLDVLLTGNIYDEGLARSLVTAKLSHAGVVLHETEQDSELLSALVRQPMTDVPVEVSGASWWWPRKVPSLLPGEYVTVLATLKNEATPEVRVGRSTPVRPEPLEVAAPLLRRAYARAKLSSLEARLSALPSDEIAQRTRLEAELTALSIRQRVLSSRTALLVLETERDYQLYQIPRAGLSDILTVGKNGIRVLSGEERARTIAAFSTDARRPGQGSGAPSAESPDSKLRMGTSSGLRDLERSRGGTLADVLSSPQGMRMGNAAEVLAQASSIGVPTAGSDGTAIPDGSVMKGVFTLVDGIHRLAGDRETDELEREFKKRARAIQICYEQQLRRNPTLRGTISFRMDVHAQGLVQNPVVTDSNVDDPAVASCLTDTVKRFRFSPSQPGAAPISSFEGSARFTFERRPPPPPPKWTPMTGNATSIWPDNAPPNTTLEEAYEGPLLTVMTALQAGNVQGALEEAWRFRADEPGSVLALIAVGQVLIAHGENDEAARAFGSIIDLLPSRTELRRTAGNYLEQLNDPSALALAIDTYEKAREQRPDHPHSHRLHAWALVKAGRHAEAFQALRDGYTRLYPPDRVAGAHAVLAQDLAIVATAWQRAEPSASERIAKDMLALELAPDTTASLRVILTWETDANDVDLHVYDSKGGHAYHAARGLSSGGALLNDVINGYGPELFRVDNPDKTITHQLFAHYYAPGPMGIGMGKLQLATHDGKGALTFEDRPFVIMKHHATLSL